MRSSSELTALKLELRTPTAGTDAAFRKVTPARDVFNRIPHDDRGVPVGAAGETLRGRCKPWYRPPADPLAFPGLSEVFRTLGAEAGQEARFLEREGRAGPTAHHRQAAEARERARALRAAASIVGRDLRALQDSRAGRAYLHEGRYLPRMRDRVGLREERAWQRYGELFDRFARGKAHRRRRDELAAEERRCWGRPAETKRDIARVARSRFRARQKLRFRARREGGHSLPMSTVTDFRRPRRRSLQERRFEKRAN